jgi:drug/metabolite transporter (DMT)-like permease
MKSPRQIAGLVLLALGGVFLVAQRVFTAIAPIWVDVGLLVLSALCVLVAVVIAKSSGTDAG